MCMDLIRRMSIYTHTHVDSASRWMLLQNQDVCLLFFAAQMELQSALNAAQGEAMVLSTTGAMIKSGMICPTKSMLDDMASTLW